MVGGNGGFSILVAMFLAAAPACGSSERKDQSRPEERAGGAGRGGASAGSGGSGGGAAVGSGGDGMNAGGASAGETNAAGGVDGGVSGSGGGSGLAGEGTAGNTGGRAGASGGGDEGGSSGCPQACVVGERACSGNVLSVCTETSDGCAVAVLETCEVCGSETECDSELDHTWGEEATRAFSLAFDGAGNLFTVGDVPPGPVPITALVNPEQAGLVKWSPEGEVMWTTWFGGVGYDSPVSVTTDPAGNAYSVTHSGAFDDLRGVLHRLHADGSPGWTFTYQSPDRRVEVSAVTADAEDLRVTGSTQGAVDGQSRQGGASDGFISRCTFEGERLWTRQFGSDGRDVAYDIALDDDGNAYVVGETDSALEDQPHAGLSDAFLVKWSPDGDLLWVREWGTTENDAAQSVSVSGDRIFVSGGSLGSIDPDIPLAGDRDAFVATFDPDGNRTWIRQFGGANDEVQPKITAHSDGRAFLVLTTYSPLPGVPEREVSASDILLVEVSPDGDLTTLAGFGSLSFDMPYAIRLDRSGTRLGVAGWTQEAGSFLKLFDVPET
jgi:hypothetical protein